MGYKTEIYFERCYFSSEKENARPWTMSEGKAGVWKKWAIIAFRNFTLFGISYIDIKINLYSLQNTLDNAEYKK
jgi:hypothetical protein